MQTGTGTSAHMFMVGATSTQIEAPSTINALTKTSPTCRRLQKSPFAVDLVAEDQRIAEVAGTHHVKQLVHDLILEVRRE